MYRFLLFIAAVIVLYFGGFIYDEVGPLLYALAITIVASTPLLLKTSFWKKIILTIPLLLLRVIGKVLLSVFGKNAFSKLLAKYGLLERRFNKIIQAVGQSKDRSINRWRNMSRQSQAYLLLIFFPVVIVFLVLMIVIEIIRLRFLQFIVEKLMQSYLMKWTHTMHPKITEAEIVAEEREALAGTEQDVDQPHETTDTELLKKNDTPDIKP